jgi:hypothetical protein
MTDEDTARPDDDRFHSIKDTRCDNEDILNHGRDANATHVRGCRVVDHVLGKE